MRSYFNGFKKEREGENVPGLGELKDSFAKASRFLDPRQTPQAGSSHTKGYCLRG